MDAPTDYFPKDDNFAVLNTNLPLSEKLLVIHRVIAQQLTFLDRIAVALYEADTGFLKTFLSSDRDGKAPIATYRMELKNSPSLSAIAETRKPRVINDIDLALSGSDLEQRIRRKGYLASYTVPMFFQDRFSGLVFFNASRKYVFKGAVIQHLNMLAHLLALTVMNDLSRIGTLTASIRIATGFMRSRDFETGGHLERMAHYSRLIAMTIASERNLSDEYIEHLFLFSPLHDIGKLGIPDRVLLKPGKLDDAEKALMMTHTVKGAEMVDLMVRNFDMGQLPLTAILRNLVEFHHEALDGSGYPKGLVGEAIPIEARIIAVADIFDALTSNRPYKKAWPNDEALAELRRLAGTKVDAACVEALAGNVREIERIQSSFAETLG
jgi:HD-GYP domain-containing protein (c-di-GMP phosphodiesterase class II)